MDRRDFIGLVGAGVVGLVAGVSPVVAGAQQFSPVEALAQEDNSLEGRIAQLQRSIEQDPKNPKLHFELSKLYEEDVGRYYDEALSEFGLAVDNGLKGLPKLFRWNEPAKRLNDSGVALFSVGHYDEAIKLYESALKLNPSNPHIYGNLGMAYYQKGEYDKAVEYERKAVDLDRLSIPFHQTLGLMQLKQGNLRGTLLNLSKIVFIDPKYKGMYFGIGQAHQGLCQYDEAIKAYKTYLKHDKGDEETKGLIKECQRLLR